MQASMFNVRVAARGSERGVPDEHLHRCAVARDVGRGGPARSDRSAHVTDALRPLTDEERASIDQLWEHGFVVPDRAQERTALEAYFREVRESTDTLRVTVLTTLQCNFACDYCIQGDHGDYNKNAAKMSMETAARVADWMEARLDALSAEELRADLLRRRAAAQYAGDVLPRRAALGGVPGARRPHADQHHHQRPAADARDGRAAQPCGLNGIKITLDGDRDTHNRMRPLRGGQGTFDRIIANIARGRRI